MVPTMTPKIRPIVWLSRIVREPFAPREIVTVERLAEVVDIGGNDGDPVEDGNEDDGEDDDDDDTGVSFVVYLS